MDKPEPDTNEMNLDLAKEEADVQLQQKNYPPIQDYNPEPGRDKTRSVVTILLVSILAGVILLGFISLWRGVPLEDLERLLNTSIAAITGMTGVALGFYFSKGNN